MKFRRFSVSVTDEVYETVLNICRTTDQSISNVTRDLIQKGLAYDWVDKNEDLIAQVVRRQLENTLNPHIKRLAALESKTGHAAATAMFLNVQAFMDLVDEDKRKLPKEMYERARKKAVAYMRTPLTDIDHNDIGD